jgi:hypothetical protein
MRCLFCDSWFLDTSNLFLTVNEVGLLIYLLKSLMRKHMFPLNSVKFISPWQLRSIFFFLKHFDKPNWMLNVDRKFREIFCIQVLYVFSFIHHLWHCKFHIIHYYIYGHSVFNVHFLILVLWDLFVFHYLLYMYYISMHLFTQVN